MDDQTALGRWLVRRAFALVVFILLYLISGWTGWQCAVVALLF